MSHFVCYIAFGAIKTGVTELNVLCVDDSRLTLLSLRRKIGCIVPEARVTACRNARQAVDSARKNGCDVLLTELDIGGSETGGLELARRIREINPNVNIIFVTVASEWEHAKDVLQVRPSGYVRKPFNQEELAGEFANLRYAVP